MLASSSSEDHNMDTSLLLRACSDAFRCPSSESQAEVDKEGVCAHYVPHSKHVRALAGYQYGKHMVYRNSRVFLEVFCVLASSFPEDNMNTFFLLRPCSDTLGCSSSESRAEFDRRCVHLLYATSTNSVKT